MHQKALLQDWKNCTKILTSVRKGLKNKCFLRNSFLSLSDKIFVPWYKKAKYDNSKSMSQNIKTAIFGDDGAGISNGKDSKVRIK